MELPALEPPPKPGRGQRWWLEARVGNAADAPMCDVTVVWLRRHGQPVARQVWRARKSLLWAPEEYQDAIPQLTTLLWEFHMGLRGSRIFVESSQKYV